jgi:hypothetical protein
MPDYSKGKIYKIESHLGDKIYIGSTTKEFLSQRMSNHRADYRTKTDRVNKASSSMEIFREYGVENCRIVLIENYPCNSKDELISKEASYIRSLPCVNKRIPDRSEQERRSDPICKEKKNEYNKLRYQQKKDIITESSQCPCGGSYQKCHKMKHFRTALHKSYESSLTPA